MILRSSLDRSEPHFHRPAALVLMVLLVSLTDFVERCKADAVSHCRTKIPATSVVKVFKGRCYHFISDEKYWTTANETCYRYGAHLVKNSNEEINSFLTSSLNNITSWRNNGVWIGLHDRIEELRWEWTTANKGVYEPVSWTNWAEGHPGSSSLLQSDCVRMKRYDGKWRWVDTPCEALRWHYRFICEYESAITREVKPFLTSDHVEASMIYFAIFGAVAVVVCITGTASGLIVYRLFCVRRRRRAQSRARLEDNQDERCLQRAPLNTYVKLDEVVAQKPPLDVVGRVSEEDDGSGESGIYEEVPLFPPVNVLEVTYQNQVGMGEYLQMNRGVGSTEMMRQARSEGEDSYQGPGLYRNVPTDRSALASDVPPPPNSLNRASDVTDNKHYEEIGPGRQVQLCRDVDDPTSQTVRSSDRETYYNVTNQVNASSGDGRHLYERMDNVRTA